VGRLLGSIVVVLLIGWVIAHMLYLGPVREAAELTVAWIVWLAAASGLVAAVTVLAFGLLQGRSSPAWLRFVKVTRTAAALIGGAVVIVGLLHYRDTEPRGEVHWIVLGLAVLAGAAVVHWWVLRTQRRML
jgi:hypothetical protein